MVCRHDDAYLFLEPVDLRQVPDYAELVAHPMDFSTIRLKIEALEYRDAAGFAADMRLVFRNCETYNPDGSDERCVRRARRQIGPLTADFLVFHHDRRAGQAVAAEFERRFAALMKQRKHRH
jgi:hypothetical protein